MMLRAPIPGLNGAYSVDMEGNVWREAHVTFAGVSLPLKKILEHCHKETGYIQCKIRRPDGTTRTVRKHRLVALAWLPVPSDPDKTTVNHIDGNKHNNSPSNLEWASLEDQMAHVKANGLRGKTVTRVSKETSEAIAAAYVETTNIHHLAKHFGRSRDVIRFHLRKHGVYNKP